MSEVRPEETAAALLRRYELQTRQAEERSERIRAGLQEKIPDLARKYGARRIWLFGSLAWGGIHPHSDVDLAVEGMSGVSADRLMAELWEVLGARVEVVAMEQAPPSLRDRILADGLILYEA